MSIRFRCKCGKEYARPNEDAGRRVLCSKCGAEFRIPQETQRVFISHATDADGAIALQICEALEQRGIRCWLAQRDIPRGKLWPAEIINGIEISRLMIVLLSATSNRSEHIVMEVERAMNHRRPLLVFRLEPVTLSKSLEYFLSSRQWIDATQPPLEARIRELCDAVEAL